MQHEPLTDDNFFLYCAKYYDSAKCASDEEFYEDIKRISYIKKLITRYQNTGDLKERLILNHIIVLTNMFGAIATPRLLYLKLKNEFDAVKPFLIYLSILPEKLYNINNEGVIDTNLISMDETIIEALRKI